MAAHQRVIEDDHFQNMTLPRMAAKLSERLVSALNPILRDGTELRLAAARILQDAFLEALKIKSLGMIGNHMFEIIWPEYNSSFPCLDMIKRDSLPCSSTLETQGKVALVLLPGIQVYRCKKRMVDYRGFVKGGEQGLEDPTTMAAPVVLTQ
jgi:hypothetical protein